MEEVNLLSLVERARCGDAEAFTSLITFSADRLLVLTRHMLHAFPKLRRWEETDDIFQNAMIRLQKALEKNPIESPKHFFNLAALQIRRELLEMKRTHFGKYGQGSHHASTDIYGKAVEETLGRQPEEIEDWMRFHQAVERLTVGEQEVVNLLYYQGVNQEEAATIIGVSLRTLKRNWHSIRCKLHNELGEQNSHDS